MQFLLFVRKVHVVNQIHQGDLCRISKKYFLKISPPTLQERKRGWRGEEKFA